MIALDTETTGVDLYHGAKPYFVTICTEQMTQHYWEWQVDPITREPQIPEEDIEEIKTAISVGNNLVLQNPKFDCAALRTIGISNFPWERTYDTLMAGHLLATNQPHNLTDMAIQYLGINIEPYEIALKKVVQECRRLCRTKFPTWKIAKEGYSDMPSVKASSPANAKTGKDPQWKFDAWLPLAIANEMNYRDDHPYRTVLRDYANADSAVTVRLYPVMAQEIVRRGLWEIYLERLKLLPIAAQMEARGITLSGDRLFELLAEYGDETERCNAVCVNIASDMNYDLHLPKGGNNKSLDTFLFTEQGLNLPAIKTSDKTGKPSFDKSVIDTYLNTLPRRSRELLFIQKLAAARKRQTAITYMEGYQRYWLLKSRELIDKGNEEFEYEDWYVLHPNLNPTGTDTLRWSSSNPNEQNISKQEGFNLRYCFGAAPGREWWSLDAKNLELRIPTFEAQEPEVMDIFNRPNDPPYYGSYHLAVFDTLHPILYREYGKKCKDLFESTWYQWVKNGNFAVIYGCQERKADETYHVPGAYRLIQKRFPKIAELAAKQIAFANKYGYVETIPDRSICAERGYPILCSRSESGYVLPTVPLNYHVSGTAMWWTCRAMVEVQKQLDIWNNEAGIPKHDIGNTYSITDTIGNTYSITDTIGNPKGYYLALQVHDELVVDLPKRADPTKHPDKSNLSRIKQLAAIMAKCGDNIGVPTPVGIEYHPNDWSKGITFA